MNLMKDGAQADGLVLAVKLHQPTLQIYGNQIVTNQIVTLQVKFEDNTTIEIDREIKEKDHWDPVLIGRVLPMRYDPEDRSKIEIDIDAMKAHDSGEQKHAAAENADRAPSARGAPR